MVLGCVLGVHGETSLSFQKGKLNCISVYLTRAKLEFSMAITHERWVLTSFLSRASLALFLVNFPYFLGLGLINYGLIINYQRLTIKL
jgi:hypothetical protein